MGDRCRCSLYVGSTLDPEAYELMVGELGEPDEMSEDLTWISYEEINYGEMPEKLKAYLEASKTPFAWWSGAGDSYHEQVMLFDGESLSDWVMIAGDIMVPTDIDPALLIKATAAHAFWETL